MGENSHLERLAELTEQLGLRDAQLRSIEWMLRTPGTTRSLRLSSYVPEYGDVAAVGEPGRILRAVGKDLLLELVCDYLDLLGTSGAVYEIDGTYALGLVASGWCRLLETASRRLCKTDDNAEAMSCGQWKCHESCWHDASKQAIDTGKPADIECAGGLRLYAVPVCAGGEVVGCMNFGYGSPPTDKEQLAEIAREYRIEQEELIEASRQYLSRPEFLIEFAKSRLETTAKVVGEFVYRKESS